MQSSEKKMRSRYRRRYGFSILDLIRVGLIVMSESASLACRCLSYKSAFLPATCGVRAPILCTIDGSEGNHGPRRLCLRRWGFIPAFSKRGTQSHATPFLGKWAELGSTPDSRAFTGETGTKGRGGSPSLR